MTARSGSDEEDAQLSDDSSLQSALLNAQHFGLDGEVALNNRLDRIETGLAEESGALAAQLPIGPANGQGVEEGLDGQPIVCLIISEGEFAERETEQLMIYRLGGYFLANKGDALGSLHDSG